MSTVRTLNQGTPPSPPLPSRYCFPEVGTLVDNPHDASRALSDASESFVVFNRHPEGRMHDLTREELLNAVQADRLALSPEDGLHHLQGPECRTFPARGAPPRHAHASDIHTRRI